MNRKRRGKERKHPCYITGRWGASQKDRHLLLYFIKGLHFNFIKGLHFNLKLIEFRMSFLNRYQAAMNEIMVWLGHNPKTFLNYSQHFSLQQSSCTKGTTKRLQETWRILSFIFTVPCLCSNMLTYVNTSRFKQPTTVNTICGTGSHNRFCSSLQQANYSGLYVYILWCLHMMKSHLSCLRRYPIVQQHLTITDKNNDPMS